MSFTDEISLDENSDLILYGLGFMNVKSKCKIKIFGLDSDKFEIRTSIFGGKDE